MLLVLEEKVCLVVIPGFFVYDHISKPFRNITISKTEIFGNINWRLVRRRSGNLSGMSGKLKISILITISLKKTALIVC